MMEGHPPLIGQFWALLLNDLSQTIELLAIWWHSLILWEQHNKSFP